MEAVGIILYYKNLEVLVLHVQIVKLGPVDRAHNAHAYRHRICGQDTGPRSFCLSMTGFHSYSTAKNAMTENKYALDTANAGEL
jgi:hypothetical protein